MNNLNDFLKQHFTIRVDQEGNELEKPSDFCLSSLSETQAHSKRWEAYNQATEQIKKPTLNELCKVLRQNMDKLSVQDIIDLTEQYAQITETT